MAWPLSQDYNEAIQSPATCLADPELKAGEPAVNALGMPQPRSGNFADVYEFLCPAAGTRWAVKCFTREVKGLRERYAEVSDYLQQVHLPFTVEFQYLEQGLRIRGAWYPALKMRWIEGLLLNEFVRDNLAKPARLQALSQIWLRLAKRLREAGMAHADLQHGNVILVPGSTANSLAVKLIDYDGMFVPALAGKKSGEVGHPNYQHPQRLREGTYSAEVDRFPLLVVATALRVLAAAGGQVLWQRYDNGDNLLFKETDLRAPAESALFQELRQATDPLTKRLVGALEKGCVGRLENVPLLEELLPEEKPAARAVVKGAGAVAQTAGAAAESMDWDFDREGPAPVRRRGTSVRPWAWAAGGVLAAMLLVGGILLATRTGPEKQPEPPVAVVRPAKGPKGKVQPPPKRANKRVPVDVEPREGESFTNSVGMQFVWIKLGTFRMGSPPREAERSSDETPHRVTLTKGFHLGVHLVTQHQWEQVMGKGANKSRFMGKDDDAKEKLPVDNVTWTECQEFCRKLGELEGRRYRLPTEAEWEYACRAGTTTAFWWGDSITTDQANYNGNFTYGKKGKKGEYRRKPTPVGFFEANPWGLYDMHGNLWQWCEDWYGPYGESYKTNPLNTTKDKDARVLRGGCWNSTPGWCRAASRYRRAPGNRADGVGCRVALCLDSKSELKLDPKPKPKPDPKPRVGPTEGASFTNTVGMQFVWIKPGTFRMGSPPREAERSSDETPHRVTLTKGYHLGVHLVTQHQWEQVMGKDANQSRFKGKSEDEKQRLPVDSVTWTECQAFCRKLGMREGMKYRLPTEAEWEYACRAGTMTVFWWGDGITTDQANYNGDYTYGKDGKKGEYRRKTTPVGFFKANPWGLYDMHGNLWQWCEDRYGPYGESDKTDHLNTIKGKDARVLRGASWSSGPEWCRAASRGERASGFRRDDFGCRVTLCLD